jgi:hypothetical protein
MANTWDGIERRQGERRLGTDRRAALRFPIKSQPITQHPTMQRSMSAHYTKSVLLDRRQSERRATVETPPTAA